MHVLQNVQKRQLSFNQQEQIEASCTLKTGHFSHFFGKSASFSVSRNCQLCKTQNWT